MKLNRKPPVRCRNENAPPRNAPDLTEKANLLRTAANVLPNGTRVHEVKCAVPKREASSVCEDEPKPSIFLLKKRSVAIDPRRG
jgi:hypothetical protein